MSDASQGPGWWQASDGKWYPPPPPPPPPPQAEPRSEPEYGAYIPPPGSPSYGPPPTGAFYDYGLGPAGNQGRPLAAWWQRLVAIFIDGCIIGIVYSILIGIVVGSSFRSGNVTHFGVKVWVVELIVGIGGIAYFALLQGNDRGQSLGQMALGIAVRDATTGGPIGPQRAGTRMVILYPWLVLIWIPFIGPFLAFFGDIWSLICGLSPLWNSSQQGYHDVAERTIVVKTR